jgi:hypothetical protein
VDRKVLADLAVNDAAAFAALVRVAAEAPVNAQPPTEPAGKARQAKPTGHAKHAEPAAAGESSALGAAS